MFHNEGAHGRERNMDFLFQLLMKHFEDAADTLNVQKRPRDEVFLKKYNACVEAFVLEMIENNHPPIDELTPENRIVVIDTGVEYVQNMSKLRASMFPQEDEDKETYDPLDEEVCLDFLEKVLKVSGPTQRIIHQILRDHHRDPYLDKLGQLFAGLRDRADAEEPEKEKRPNPAAEDTKKYTEEDFARVSETEKLRIFLSHHFALV